MTIEEIIQQVTTICKDNGVEHLSLNPEDKFILSGTVQMFNLSFDLSWKVMKDLIREVHGALEYPVGSPWETLRMAHSVGRK